MSNIEKVANYLQASNPSFPTHDKGRYMLLGRLQQDAEYYIKHPHIKHLWSGNVKDQIKDMKELYNLLPEKPEWITMKDILQYEKDMIKSEKSAHTASSELKIDNVLIGKIKPNDSYVETSPKNEDFLTKKLGKPQIESLKNHQIWFVWYYKDYIIGFDK